MNVEGKEIMISKLIDVLPTILDRYNVSKLIHLMWKNNLIKQIDISQENRSSQVGSINDNSNNNCKESKGKATSDPNPDQNKKKMLIFQKTKKLSKIKKNEIFNGTGSK
jgi:hypothetical protein